jgi:hypothetical protein
MMKIQALTIPAIASNDREIKPSYKCFCCRDCGLVSNLSLSNYVEGKNPYPFICQRMECDPGRAYMKAWTRSDEERAANAAKNGGIAIPQKLYQAQFDARLSCYQCEEMHKAELKAWEKQMWRSKKA